jgi:hypothetical protein
MKKKLAILIAAVVLALVLAMPASASQSVPFSAIGYDTAVVDVKSAGNRCFITALGEARYEGDLGGTGTYEYHTMAKGSCSAAAEPGTFAEVFHVEKQFTGPFLDREGTMSASCQGQFYVDEPKRWEGHCVLRGESGELVGMHGTMEWMGLFSEQGTRSYWGQVHFDPQ